MQNPYQAPDEIVPAELVKPDRQFPPLGYMFIAAVMLQATFCGAWYSIPYAVNDDQWGAALVFVAMTGVAFLCAALALRPVLRWWTTGRYH